MRVSRFNAVSTFLLTRKPNQPSEWSPFSLNNNDVTLDSARRSSCLNPTDFALALRNITRVLKPELNPKKRRKEITYDILHEKYHVGMSFSTFSTFLRQAENALIQLDGRLQLESPYNRCAIFFWASSIIKVSFHDSLSLDLFICCVIGKRTPNARRIRTRQLPPPRTSYADN